MEESIRFEVYRQLIIENTKISPLTTRRNMLKAFITFVLDKDQCEAKHFEQRNQELEKEHSALIE
jgi:hypothetical protein